MLERIITASALILAILAARKLFWNTLSRRVQYALWGLVLLRLLIPWNLPAASFSLLTAARPVQQAVEQRLTVSVPVAPSAPVIRNQNTPASQEPLETQTVSPAVPESTQEHSTPREKNGTTVQPAATVPAQTTAPRTSLSLTSLLNVFWMTGAGLMALFLGISNLRFALRMRRCRTLLREAEPGHPAVYLVPDEAVSSPCLFGAKIYVPRSAAGDPERLRMILLHEETHARHLDPLWSLLRGLCLALWWFNPLVWIAAFCSRTDCELACDESVLARLSADEGYLYGKTLLSMVSVNRGASPLCAATAMSAGKRQLKDRITRIARPRQMLAATLAVVLLAFTVCACTFTGPSVSASSGSSSGEIATALSHASLAADSRSLTGQELRWFNTSFFNDEENHPLRTQLASPLNQYATPAEVDLYQLFYNESSGSLTAEEWKAVFDVENENDAPCPAFKLTTGDMHRLLEENLGLSLEETERKGLDLFDYRSDYDAYYWMKGDTNWPGELTFACGTRKGDVVKLYQRSGFDGYGMNWLEVTLQEQEDGSWHFLSNLACLAPAIPPALPERDPVATISLNTLTPYEAPALTLTDAPAGSELVEVEDMGSRCIGVDGFSVGVYTAPDGSYHGGVQKDDGPVRFFLDLPGDSELDWFEDFGGYSGFIVIYTAELSPRTYGNRADYFTLSEDGTPSLLARMDLGGVPALQTDLDGDGIQELATPNEVFFFRDGTLYRLDTQDLLMQAVPEDAYIDWAGWDSYSRLCTTSALGMDERTYFRTASLTKDAFVIWDNNRTSTDHVVDGAAGGVPDDVVAMTKEWVEENALNFFSDCGPCDDWRIESFGRGYTWTLENPWTNSDVTLQGWSFNYEVHPLNMENVELAGGRYVDEYGWVSPGYPGCDWLFFRLDGEKRTLIDQRMINDMSPDSEAFQQMLESMAFDG